MLVTTVHHALPPRLIGHVPSEGPTQAFRQRDRGCEAEITLDLAAIDRVAPVMSGTVRYEAAQRSRRLSLRRGTLGKPQSQFRLPPEALIGFGAQQLHQLEVLVL